MNTPKNTTRQAMYDTVLVAGQARMSRQILNTVGENYGEVKAVAISATNPQLGWARVFGWNEDAQDEQSFWILVTSDIVEMS